MKVAVIGLWHLGCVTAAAISEHFPVTAWDPDDSTVRSLRVGKTPIYEPGLDAMILGAIQAGRLDFTTDRAAAVSDADIVWITFDTPVDDGDHPDSDFVVGEVTKFFPFLRAGTTVLVSSQVPVGTTRSLMEHCRALRGNAFTFACSPENLRLGQALEVFRNPGQIVVGTDPGAPGEALSKLFARLNGEIRWMSIESAEMTKHAINSFLAVSIAYINEIARLCELTGADVREVEAALRAEPRIGSRAYLSPGIGFSGGTLGRDISALREVARHHGVPVGLLDGVATSNELQRTWTERRLADVLGKLEGTCVAVLGLTYKAGTDTLRRSTAIQLCKFLLERGAKVRAYDPAVKTLPGVLRDVRLCSSPSSALSGADAAVIATEWPAFRDLTINDVEGMAAPRIFDPKNVLSRYLRERVEYFSVGIPAGNRSNKV